MSDVDRLMSLDVIFMACQPVSLLASFTLPYGSQPKNYSDINIFTEAFKNTSSVKINNNSEIKPFCSMFSVCGKCEFPFLKLWSHKLNLTKQY